MSLPEPEYSIIVLFDSSGSMEVLLKAHPTPVEIINEFIEEQKNLEGFVNLSLYFFSDSFTPVIENKPVKNVESIKNEDYNPDGTTALYDAIGHVIKKFDKNKKVFMVILTDGEENSSSVFNSSDIHLMIKNKKEIGWKFKFFGANQDTWKVGRRFGLDFSDCNNFNYNSVGLSCAIRTASQDVYNTVLSSQNFTIPGE